jgi:hypothetical protein
MLFGISIRNSNRAINRHSLTAWVQAGLGPAGFIS